jgi:hypothetical protein
MQDSWREAMIVGDRRVGTLRIFLLVVQAIFEKRLGGGND